MPKHQRLAMLVQLRKAAGVTLAQMAHACGLRGKRAYESVAAWERGEATPRPAIRDQFLLYLAHTLNLANQPATLRAVWEVLVEEWGWEPLQPPDWVLIEQGALAAPAAHESALPWRTVPEPSPLPAGSLLPFAPYPHFVGRADELLVLANLLRIQASPIARQPLSSPPTSVILTGPGGVGKTQLAIEFAYRFGRFFLGGVFWLSLANAEAAPGGVALCGTVMNLHPHFERLTLDDQVRLVTQAWAEDTVRLLIFDSCEDESLLYRWLPQRGGCRVLVTSRRHLWPQRAGLALLPLGLLSRAQSVELLRKHCPLGQSRDEELIAIAAELDDLPLALHVAGSYLSSGIDTVTPAQYLADLRQSLAGYEQSPPHPSLRGKGPRGRSLPAPTGHLNHFEQIVALSIDRLDRRDPVDGLAYRLLLAAAWFAPGEPIPLDLLRATLRSSTEQMRFQTAVQRMLDTGLLLPVDAGAAVVRLHRLVAAFLRRLADAREAQVAAETALLVHVRRLNDACDVPALLRLQGHLQVVTQIALLRADALAATLAFELSRHLAQIEQFDAALSYNQRSLELRQRLFGPDSLPSSANLHYHALLLDWMGDYPRAYRYHEQALAIRLRWLGPDHPDTATSFLYAGEGAQRMCDYPAAQRYYEQALAIRSRVFGPESPQAAELYNHLSFLFGVLGEFDAALPYAQRAVAIWDAQPQPNRSLQAMAINNLGYLHRVRAEYDLALEYLRRALAIRQEIYATSSYIGMTRNHIGRVYYYQGRYAQALIELEAALAMIEAAVGREHPYTANVLSNLGIVALDMGDTAQAQRQLAEALDIHRRMVGPEHWYVARDLNRLGLLRLSLGDNAAAYRCFRTAWRIRRRIFGELHPDTANTLSHIGMLYLTNGRMPQARLLATEALRCHQLRLGERHPYTARSLLRVGQVYAALGDQAAARDYVARAIAIYLAVLGPDHPYTRAARQAAG